MAAGDLTSVEKVKAQGVGSGTGPDGALAALVAQASAFLRSATNWPYGLGSVSYSEIYSGSGGSQLYLRNPVSTVTSLVVGAGSPIAAQVANGQRGYFLDGQVLCLNGYCFTRGRKNVRVSYSGDAGTGADIEQAVIEMVSAAYKRVPRGPELSSETILVSGAVVSFSLKDVPAYAASVIQNRTKVVPA